MDVINLGLQIFTLIMVLGIATFIFYVISDILTDVGIKNELKSNFISWIVFIISTIAIVLMLSMYLSFVISFIRKVF